MGLIQAAVGAIGGTLADQWVDFYGVPDGIGSTVAVFPAVAKGQNAGRGSNTQGYVCGNGQCETTLGESATNCQTDCGGGQGSGSGSGGGNTSLDCNDPNTQIGCLLCTTLQMCTSPYDATSCAACGGGSGGSLPCNFDGVCDPGEDSATCPLDGCP